MALARESGRSTRRNMLLILAVVIGVVLVRQAGFLGQSDQAAPLDRIDVAAFDAALAALPIVPVFDEGTARGVRLVEFFDYRCDHCRRMGPVIHKILDGGADIHLVPLELPILGPESILAARYALAADLQNGYGPYHRALMFSTVPFDDAGLTDLGAALGLDPVRLAADAQSQAVTDALNAMRALAASIHVDGTPAFVIGDIVVVGSVDEASLLGLLAAERNP